MSVTDQSYRPARHEATMSGSSVPLPSSPQSPVPVIVMVVIGVDVSPLQRQQPGDHGLVTGPAGHVQRLTRVVPGGVTQQQVTHLQVTATARLHQRRGASREGHGAGLHQRRGACGGSRRRHASTSEGEPAAGHGKVTATARLHQRRGACGRSREGHGWDTPSRHQTKSPNVTCSPPKNIPLYPRLTNSRKYFALENLAHENDVLIARQAYPRYTTSKAAATSRK